MLPKVYSELVEHLAAGGTPSTDDAISWAIGHMEGWGTPTAAKLSVEEADVLCAAGLANPADPAAHWNWANSTHPVLTPLIRALALAATRECLAACEPLSDDDIEWRDFAAHESALEFARAGYYASAALMAARIEDSELRGETLKRSQAIRVGAP